MSTSRLPFLLTGLVIAASAVVTPTVAAKTAGAPTPPWRNPKNYVLNYPVRTAVGPVCVGRTCRYLPLAGTLLTLHSVSGKLIRTAHTNASGLATILLPKGLSKLTFSHGPWKGHALGSKTYTIKAPVYMPPPTYFVFTFCLSQDC